MDGEASDCRRRFFRTHSQIGLRVQRLDPERWNVEERAILANRSVPAEPIDTELARWLDRIEQKLDRVLEHLGTEGAARGGLQEVVISGSGIRFDDEAALVIGSRVLLELELPGTPVRRIRCLGSVVGVEASEQNRQAAVRFDVIREIDRDCIIEHSLRVEGGSLRARSARTLA